MTVGTSIIQIEAKDADTGPNGDVHYRLKQDLAGHWRTFHIDDTTGIISLKLPLDRETQKLYEVIQITFFIKKKVQNNTREKAWYMYKYTYILYFYTLINLHRIIRMCYKLSFSQNHPGDIDFNVYFYFNLDREL